MNVAARRRAGATAGRGLRLAIASVLAIAAPWWIAVAPVRAEPAPQDAAERQQVLDQIDTVGRRGFLYEVTPADSRTDHRRLFLYGTIHLGRVGNEPFNPPVVEALRASCRLALEADPTDESVARRLTMQLGRYGDGDSLQRHLSPVQMARLTTYGRRQGLAVEELARFKPWVLANMLTLKSFGHAGLDPALGSELYLSGFARARGMPIVEIEGMETQLRLLAGLPEAMQVAQLDEALNDVESSNTREGDGAIDGATDGVTRGVTRGATDGVTDGVTDGATAGATGSADEAPDDVSDDEALFDLWSSGDAAAADALVAQLHRQADERPYGHEFVERVIDARNRSMADRAERELKRRGPTFFAVGALHLFGATGLVAELRRRGLRVEDLQAAGASRSSAAPGDASDPCPRR